MSKKRLIVCYWQAVGNTKPIAEALVEATGGELAAIETVQPYTGSYNHIVDRGSREV